MTTAPRPPITPATLDAQAFATRRTARARHPGALAVLAGDAATGHPGQRVTILRTTGDTHSGFYWPSYPVVRALRLAATLAFRTSTPVGTDAATLALTVTDGTITVLASDPAIPPELSGTTDLYAVRFGTRDRWASATHLAWTIDVGELVGAGLDPSLRWRFTLVSVCDATVVLERFQIEELPRFTVDDTDGAGSLPSDFLARAPIVDGDAGLTRIEDTITVAYEQGLRTYQAEARGESDPWTVASTTFVPFGGGLDIEPGGAAAVRRVHPRKVRGAAADGCRVRFCVRYKTSGATGATVRVYTGGSAGSYDLILPGTSGAWADSDEADAYLSTLTDSDTIAWAGKIASGTLSVCTRTVVDHPA